MVHVHVHVGLGLGKYTCTCISSFSRSCNVGSSPASSPLRVSLCPRLPTAATTGEWLPWSGRSHECGHHAAVRDTTEAVQSSEPAASPPGTPSTAALPRAAAKVLRTVCLIIHTCIFGGVGGACMREENILLCTQVGIS